MELKEVTNTNEFKKLFFKSFSGLRNENPSFNKLIYEVSLTTNLFVVGGYLRCVANNDSPRDLDLIINLSKDKLNDIVIECFSDYSVNRMGGYKVQLEKIVVDMWSIEDNWAFKNRVVKNVELNHLEKISKGTFFNFDSLVFDLHTQQYNFKNYNKCANKKQLDILKKSSNYKRLNPTKEANILRAFYLKRRYILTFSNQLKSYILEYLKYSNQTFGDCSVKLIEALKRYTKYQNHLDEKVIKEEIRILENPSTVDETPAKDDLFYVDNGRRTKK